MGDCRFYYFHDFSASPHRKKRKEFFNEINKYLTYYYFKFSSEDKIINIEYKNCCEEDEIIDKINSIVKNKARISINEPMKAHTVFRIGGNADVYISIANEEELVSLISLFKEENVPYFLIGNGSNLLVSDDGFRGVVLEIGKDYAGISCEYKEVVALAGTMLSKVSHVACDNSLTGLEFASGIPGTVGGAVIMNAGAYGGEIKQVASKVKVLLPNGEIKWLSNEEMEFEYRNSKAKKEGYNSILAFVIQMEGIEEVLPNVEMQPEFGVAIEDAKCAGVEIIFIRCRVYEDNVIALN